MRRSLTARPRVLFAGTALAALALATTVFQTAGADTSSGEAHVSSNTPACVSGSDYYASVTGSAIASVAFALDGRLIATVSRPNSRGAFGTRLGLTAGRAHRLTMTVDFTAASRSTPTRLQRTIARCAAKIRKKKTSTTPVTETAPSSETVAPAFTG